MFTKVHFQAESTPSPDLPFQSGLLDAFQWFWEGLILTQTSQRARWFIVDARAEKYKPTRTGMWTLQQALPAMRYFKKALNPCMWTMLILNTQALGFP